MRITKIVSTAVLVAQVYGAACPYELLKRSGLLSEDDTAAFEAVKRDPSEAEALFEAHRRKVEGAPEGKLPKRSASDSILDLPFGGGLCESVL